MTNAHMPPVHPGEILAEDFLGPLAISQNKLARTIGVDPMRISKIVHGERDITADTALRLARALGTTEQFWMNLQNRYDLEVKRDEFADAHVLEDIRPLAHA